MVVYLDQLLGACHSQIFLFQRVTEAIGKSWTKDLA